MIFSSSSCTCAAVNFCSPQFYVYLDGYFFLMFAIHLWFHLLVPSKYRRNLLLAASSFSVPLFLNNQINIRRIWEYHSCDYNGTNCWDVRLCSPVEFHWSVGGTYCLYLHGWRPKQASNNKKLAASRSFASVNSYRTAWRHIWEHSTIHALIYRQFTVGTKTCHRLLVIRWHFQHASNEWMNIRGVGHNNPALAPLPSMTYCASPLINPLFILHVEWNVRFCL
jgi:hypothetical protein